MSEVKIQQTKPSNQIEMKNIEDFGRKESEEDMISPPRHRETNYSSQSVDLLQRLESATFQIKEKDTFANASSLGYFAFGMDLFIYSLALIGATKIDSLVISDLLCVGGFAQATAGVFSFIQAKTVEAAIFLLYSVLAMMLCTNVIFDKCSWGIPINDNEYMGLYSFWCMLCFGLFWITFKRNVVLTLMVFFMFWMQFMKCFSHGLQSKACMIASGVFGFLSSLCGIYLGYAELLNESFEKIIIPVFPYEKLCKKD